MFKRVVTHFEEAKEFLSLMVLPHDIVDVPGATDFLITQGDIVFDKVSFGYSNKISTASVDKGVSSQEIENFFLSISA